MQPTSIAGKRSKKWAIPLRFVCAAAQVFAYEPTALSLYLRGRASRVIAFGRPAAAFRAFFLFFLLCEAVAVASHMSMSARVIMAAAEKVAETARNYN